MSILEKPEHAYRVYTDRYDEELRAADLLAADPERRALARAYRDRTGPETGTVWEGAELNAARAALDAFARALPGADPQRPLILLLDNSGSLRGRTAFGLVELVGQMGDALDRAGVPFEVLGFTTRGWKGGQARKDWVEAGRPASPGRLCELRHLVYRDAGEPWDPEPLNLMMTEGVLKENVDGEALLWAAERGRRLGGARIVMVTDGFPMDNSTLAENPMNYLERHLREVVREVEADPDLDLFRADISHERNPTSGRNPPEVAGLGRVATELVRATLQALASAGPAADQEGPPGP
jgi:cobaltochelatase CobT